jgi:NAD(P)-dependent dehydrogenase (short-subunit alcohol dehydrogenase family)
MNAPGRSFEPDGVGRTGEPLGVAIISSSVFGLFAQPGMSGYNATKYAVRGFSAPAARGLSAARRAERAAQGGESARPPA